jgi:hypothetical protein
MGFWFKVIFGNDSAAFDLYGFGSGIQGPIELTCDVQPLDQNGHATPRSPRPKFGLPDLRC